MYCLDDSLTLKGTLSDWILEKDYSQFRLIIQTCTEASRVKEDPVHYPACATDAKIKEWLTGKHVFKYIVNKGIQFTSFQENSRQESLSWGEAYHLDPDKLVNE